MPQLLAVPLFLTHLCASCLLKHLMPLSSLMASFHCLSRRKVHAEEISPHRRGRPDSQSTQAAADRHRAPQTEQGDQRLDPCERAAADCTAEVAQGEEQAGIQVKHKCLCMITLHSI